MSDPYRYMSLDELSEWQRPTFGDRFETILGRTKRGHEILHWGCYGVTCPDEITTNGNFLYLLCYREIASLTPPGAAFVVGFFIWLLARRCREAGNGEG